MDELPPCLLLNIVLRLGGVVPVEVAGRSENESEDAGEAEGEGERVGYTSPVEVAVQRAQHDHGHHAGEEEHDHERVDDREPMNLLITHQQVGVPSGGPLDLRGLPLDVICEDDFAWG